MISKALFYRDLFIITYCVITELYIQHEVSVILVPDPKNVFKFTEREIQNETLRRGSILTCTTGILALCRRVFELSRQASCSREG